MQIELSYAKGTIDVEGIIDVTFTFKGVKKAEFETVLKKTAEFVQELNGQAVLDP